MKGWYYDNNGTETKWNFDTDTVKCTMTLKAKWELSTYSVTLQTDGGTIAGGKEVTGYTYGTGAVLPTTNDITREGYRFDGWYADSNFSGSPVTEITGTDTENKTFYAKWTKNTTPIISGNTINYIVEHYKTDGSGYTRRKQNIPQGRQVIPSQQRRKPMKALPTIRQSPPPRNVEEDQRSGGYRDPETLL